MQKIYSLKVMCTGMVLLIACDSNPTFDNSFDPASENYIPSFNPAKGILIDDFDDGKDPNLLGFCHRKFDDVGLVTIFVSYNNQRENVLRGVGRSLQIDFNVSQGGRVGYGGYIEALTYIKGNDTCSSSSSRGFFNLANLNLDSLTFWVRTTSQRRNFDVAFEVALRDSAGNQTDPKVLKLYSIPDTSWIKAYIRISALRRTKTVESGTIDLQRLREINFGFAQYLDFGNIVSSGTIYIDEIAFERSANRQDMTKEK